MAWKTYEYIWIKQSLRLKDSGSVEIIGNEDFIRIVELSKQRQPFPHTLIYGPSGAGKTTLAKYISSAINAILTKLKEKDEWKYQKCIKEDVNDYLNLIIYK